MPCHILPPSIFPSPRIFHKFLIFLYSYLDIIIIVIIIVVVVVVIFIVVVVVIGVTFF